MVDVFPWKHLSKAATQDLPQKVALNLRYMIRKVRVPLQTLKILVESFKVWRGDAKEQLCILFFRRNSSVAYFYIKTKLNQSMFFSKPTKVT